MMNIDPLLSLSLNVHSSKGIYALLIGSGVSRAAKIPTGWEVVLDLIRKLARMIDDDCEPDPAAWFRSKYGDEPDYSKLLNELSTSPEQRQQVLRAYFEPSDSERTDGLKQPTVAHKAIARLVVSGHIRVIITTNFDRLVEQAIQDAGVTPTVISTPDGFVGALPLTHQRCVVVKIHGDYLDARIKNTPVELGTYEAVIDKWLDRIFDEFGLIVVGWSGEWDTALRRAIERCSTRRFGFWWASMGEPGSVAISLTSARGGNIMRTPKGAEQFFQDLAYKVDALDDVYSDHPANVAANVALVKRFLSEPRQPIKLADLIRHEADRAYAEIAKDQDAILKSRTGVELNENFINRSISLTANLRAMVATAAYWGHADVVQPIARAMMKLAHDPTVVTRTSGIVLNDCFRMPAPIAVLYASTIGFVATNDFVSAADVMMRGKVVDRHDNQQKTVIELYLKSFQDVRKVIRAIPSRERDYFPFSELLFEILRNELTDLFPDPGGYELAFAHAELLMSLISGHLANSDVSVMNEVWTLPGRYMYRDGPPRDPLFFRQDQGEDVAWCKQQEPFINLIASSHFGGDWSRLASIRKSLATTAQIWTRS